MKYAKDLYAFCVWPPRTYVLLDIGLQLQRVSREIFFPLQKLFRQTKPNRTEQNIKNTARKRKSSYFNYFRSETRARLRF